MTDRVGVGLPGSDFHAAAMAGLGQPLLVPGPTSAPVQDPMTMSSDSMAGLDALCFMANVETPASGQKKAGSSLL